LKQGKSAVLGQGFRARFKEPFVSKSTISAFAFGAALLAAQGAFAFEGHYIAGSKDYRQQLTITHRADGRFVVTATVGTEGCSGQVADALGAADGDMLKAEAKEDSYTCVLVIRRTKKGVDVREGDGCLNFHGPSCEVSGDYRKQR
jgi:hypothetical protein